MYLQILRFVSTWVLIKGHSESISFTICASLLTTDWNCVNLCLMLESCDIQLVCGSNFLARLSPARPNSRSLLASLTTIDWNCVNLCLMVESCDHSACVRDFHSLHACSLITFCCIFIWKSGVVVFGDWWSFCSDCVNSCPTLSWLCETQCRLTCDGVRDERSQRCCIYASFQLACMRAFIQALINSVSLLINLSIDQ